MIESPYDPRSICNLMLDTADMAGDEVSNLALQKLLYFAHSLFLVEHKVPLVSGYFEAWQFGPVNPAAYRAFKSAGDKPIRFRAQKSDPLTGALTPLETATDRRVRVQVNRVMLMYGSMSPSRLVEISHAKGAPWHFVVENARTRMAFGLRISDSVILDRFKHHKISVADASSVGVPGEDSPFA